MRVPASSVDEIVQEVALRALATRVVCSSAADLWPWASTVARHLAVDVWRSSARVESGEIPDVAAAQSVDEIVEGRLRFEATIAATRGLSGTDQRYLIDLTCEPSGTGPLSSRVKVGVHRARRRLLVALGEVGAFLAGWRIRCLPRRTPSAVLLIVAVTIPLAGLLATRTPTPVPSVAPRSAPSSYDPPASGVAVSRVDRPAAPTFAAVHTPVTQRQAVSTRVVSPSPETTIPIRYPGKLPPGQITIRPRRPGDHLLCVNNVRLIGQTCT